mgnify:CR=1 FL=1
MLNDLFSLGTTSVVLMGAFLICLIGYAIGSIKIKGICLGTAGVFLIALLFGYLFTIEGLNDIPILGKFYIENAKSAAVSNYKFIESVGLVLFVTAVGYIAGPNFFRNLKKNAKSYVPLGAIIILIGSAVAVVFALIPGPDPDYAVIDGAWIDDQPYGVIHRIASDGLSHGVFAACLAFAKRSYRALRMDTHKDNRVMQALAEKNGFAYCGVVHLRGVGPRMAYQWNAPSVRAD